MYLTGKWNLFIHSQSWDKFPKAKTVIIVIRKTEILIVDLNYICSNETEMKKQKMNTQWLLAISKKKGATS